MAGRILTVVALASALMLSFAVSPAGAGTAGRAATWTDCDSLGTQFSSYGRLLETARAGKFKHQREPELGEATEIAPQPGRGDGFTETVPTWFHVVHSNGTGNVTTKAIVHQLYVLDGTFGGFEGGTASGFNFTLAGITRTNNTAWHNAGPETAAEAQMKQALHAGGNNTLNVYLTSGAGYLGWAYFPDITDTAQAYLDGVVDRLAIDAGDFDRVCGPVRQRRDPHARGRPLAEPVPHLPGRLR